MASSACVLKCLNIVLLTLAAFRMATAADPDILTDFLIPPGLIAEVNSSFFTFTGMRSVVSAPPQPAPSFKAFKASMIEFPALNGQSVSYAVLVFPNGTVNPPHTHPRSSELLFLVRGTLQVGFVDTTNQLYSQTLQAGDMFVFPKGLVHFQYNPDVVELALAYSAFGSANAGTVSLPNTLFNSSIDETTLAKAFKTDVATIEALKNGLAPKP